MNRCRDLCRIANLLATSSFLVSAHSAFAQQSVDVEAGGQQDAEQSTAVLEGVKTGTSDGALRVNATAFVYDYQDYQAFGIINFAPQDPVNGTELPLAPTISLNYLVRYKFDALSGNVAAQINDGSFDKQFLEVTNAPASLQQAYNVTNASLSWESGADVVVKGCMKNLFDKEYAVKSLDLGGLGTTQVYGATPTCGVSLRIPIGYLSRSSAVIERLHISTVIGRSKQGLT